MVTIVDYGMGNLSSVYKKFKRIGVQAIVTSNKEELMSATKIILPGVGHFKKAMERLTELDLIPTLNQKVLTEKTPVLGICLGMQLMADWSEEGDVEGLGWIKGKIVRFNVSDPLKYKVPHMGWNNLEIQNPHPLVAGVASTDRFYFVHSFHWVCEFKQDVLATSEYEYPFVCAIAHDNIVGTQFHPEKSHMQGELLLQNFAQL